MLRYLAIGSVLTCGFFILGTRAQGKNVGPGCWSVLSIMKCQNDDMMPMKLEANRRKIDRTHDGFNCNMTLDEEINEDFGVRMDICKMVDGGCKDYSTLADDSLIKFAKKYAEGNVKTAFEAAKIEPAEFPVPAGFHSIKNYEFDYDELPPEGPYGEFMASCYLIKTGRELMCSKVHVRFEEKEDEEEQCGKK